jgi:hypothetical protein
MQSRHGPCGIGHRRPPRAELVLVVERDPKLSITAVDEVASTVAVLFPDRRAVVMIAC